MFHVKPFLKNRIIKRIVPIFLMFFILQSCVGARTAYQSEGYHHNTINEFLAPFVRTTQLCRMKYFPPYVVHGSNRASEDEIVAAGQDYAFILDYFKQTEPEFEALKNYLYLNDWLTENRTV